MVRPNRSSIQALVSLPQELSPADEVLTGTDNKAVYAATAKAHVRCL